MEATNKDIAIENNVNPMNCVAGISASFFFVTVMTQIYLLTIYWLTIYWLVIYWLFCGNEDDDDGSGFDKNVTVTGTSSC